MASRKDFPILKYSLPLIRKRIRGKSFFLVHEIYDNDFFLSKNHELFGFKLIEEFSVLGDEYKKIKKIKNKILLNWYKQQIIKLKLIESCKKDEIVLIWDGDTIPLKSLNFLKNSSLGYYTSSEFHQPYYSSIKKLLGLTKTSNFSFIAQCFVVKVSWVKLMLRTIEFRNKCSYIDVIIKIANSSKLQNFSEYETMAIFIQKYFFFDTFIIGNNWFRYGFSLFSNPSSILFQASNYDFVSFESWDRSWLKSVIIKMIHIHYFFILLFKKIRKHSL